MSIDDSRPEAAQDSAQPRSEDPFMEKLRDLPRMRTDASAGAKPFRPPAPTTSRIAAFTQGCSGVLVVVLALPMLLSAVLYGFYMWGPGMLLTGGILLLAAVLGGQPMPEAAEAAGFTAQRIGPFGRNPQQAGALPPELLAPLFEAQVGDVTMAETRTGFAVARLTEVIPFNPASDPLGLGRIRSEIEQSMQDELEEQYAQALRSRADVRINRALLDQVTGR